MDLGAALVSVLGGVGASCVFAPQVLRAVQTKTTADISWGLIGGLALWDGGWLAYGLAARLLVLAIPQVVAGSLVLVLATVKWRYDGPPTRRVLTDECRSALAVLKAAPWRRLLVVAVIVALFTFKRDLFYFFRP